MTKQEIIETLWQFEDPVERAACDILTIYNLYTQERELAKKMHPYVKAFSEGNLVRRKGFTDDL